MKVTLNDEVKLIEDIYFGDVYLLAGQSNIELRLWQTNAGEEEYESNPLVRAFVTKIEKENNDYPAEEKWLKAIGCVSHWSALGWTIANRFQKETGHAIGIISCYRGASCIQSWLPKDILKGTELEFACEDITGHLRREECIDFNHDGFLYEGKFKKIIPFSLNSAIWYQGESNSRPVELARVYKGLLKTLIECWRSDLKDEKLPFVLVQIHDYKYFDEQEGWSLVQKAQAEIQHEIENVKTVNSFDVCENEIIHPTTKLPLAMRIKAALQDLTVWGYHK